MDNTGRAGVDQSLHAGVLASFDDCPCAVDVDLLVEGVGGTHKSRRGCVNDDGGLDLGEQRVQGVTVGDIGVVVVGLLAPVSSSSKVDDSDPAAIVGQQVFNDMVAEEATATNHQDGPQLWLGHCCVVAVPERSIDTLLEPFT